MKAKKKPDSSSESMQPYMCTMVKLGLNSPLIDDKSLKLVLCACNFVMRRKVERGIEYRPGKRSDVMLVIIRMARLISTKGYGTRFMMLKCRLNELG